MREILAECPAGAAKMDVFAMWLASLPEGEKQLKLARLDDALAPFHGIGYGDPVISVRLSAGANGPYLHLGSSDRRCHGETWNGS